MPISPQEGRYDRRITHQETEAEHQETCVKSQALTHRSRTRGFIHSLFFHPYCMCTMCIPGTNTALTKTDIPSCTECICRWNEQSVELVRLDSKKSKGEKMKPGREDKVLGKGLQ